jgi:hypothetical protein
MHKPAATLAEMTTNNSSYHYLAGRRDVDADYVLLCDMNGIGPVNFGTVGATPDTWTGSNLVTGTWGGNHQNEGGNFIRCSGSATWTDSTNNPSMTTNNIRTGYINMAFNLMGSSRHACVVTNY